MKKIALAWERFDRHGGGTESYAVALATSLVESGWEVHLFGLSWQGEPESAIFHEIKIPRCLPRAVKLLCFVQEHKKQVQSLEFDVVLGFGNSISMNVYQSHGGVHNLSTARTVYSEPRPAFRFVKRAINAVSTRKRVRNWIESAPFRYKQRPRIIAIAEMLKKDMISSFDVDEKEIDVIYNGVDLKLFNPVELERLRGPLRRELGMNEGDVLFLFVSYQLKKKGIFPLVEAASELKKTGDTGFKVVVVGGRASRSILKRVADLGLEDIMIFSGKSRSVKDFYANADVFVLPTYYDACSLVVIEAMASGLPVITTKYNGASGLISDGENGYVISHPPEPGELREKMQALLSHSRRISMAGRASTAVASYSVTANHKALIKVFDEVAESGERSIP